MPELRRITWPDFGAPALPPALQLVEMQGRLAAIRDAMAARGQSRLVIYADREHFANMLWATGFDPRFEEAVLIVSPDSAVLAAGNECLSYTAISPLVQSGAITPVLCSSLSLLSQPRSGGLRLSDLIDHHIRPSDTVGTAGWKYYGTEEVDHPDQAVELPSVITDLLRARAAKVSNATDLFMHPGYGLRSTVTPAEIARLEFSNHMAAGAVHRIAFGLREGMSDFEAYVRAQVGGLPLNCHSTFASGDMQAMGLSGPTGQLITKGHQISFNVAHFGSNICRAGWVAETAADLPEAAQGYLEQFAGPYVAAVSRWFALMRPGVLGGAVWDQVQADLPFDRYGISLNPGHLIGADEWISSPIYQGSDLPLRSGMAMQCDIIPGHPNWGSTRMEDGYIIADAELQRRLQAEYPALMQRVQSRQRFMRGTLGLDVPDGLLPLADTCGIVAPYLLDPGLVITL